ncbi:hypothetical protein CCP3SC15_2500001 [Gammaproteobacteria bacterium]
MRGGQSFDLLAASRTNTDYADNGDGTVTHTPSGLIWKRCAEGQTWTGSTCSGGATGYTWDQAQALIPTSFAGHSDWRVPTEDELISLVDYTILGATINTEWFPNTPASVFWSASACAGHSGSAWYVFFGWYVYSSGGSNPGSGHHGSNSFFDVRLVRGGQSFGPLALSVLKTGTGSGTVTSDPAGISCGSDCTEKYSFIDTNVTLTATPLSGSTFAGWSGDCSGTETCTVTMSAAQSVTATFTRITYALTVNKSGAGSGTVTSSPSGANCGAGCNTSLASYNDGITVTLTAAAASGSTFTGWSGSGCSGTGTCRVTMSAAKAVTANFKANQTIGVITFTPASLAVGATATASATATSGLAVTFTSQTTGVCTVSGGTVTGVTAGTCTVAANQAGDTGYNAASQVTQNLTITISSGSQTITFGAAPTVVVDGTGTLSATGGASGNPVTFTSQSPAVCSTSGTNGTTISGISTGVCTIAANQAGNANYNAAPQVTQSFTIGSGSQTITFGAAPMVVVDGSGMLSATGGASGNPVIFTSQSTDICTVSGNTVTGVSAGTCTIAASQAGSANYNAAHQVTQSFIIGSGSQTITFGATPTVMVGGSGILSATGGVSGNPVIFTSQSTGVCTVNGGAVTGVTAGTCTIAADQAGNANYSVAPQMTQSSDRSSNVINMGTVPSVVVGGGGMLSATGGVSGNPVTFTSQSPAICTTSGTNGTTISGINTGVCMIAANQIGNANYNAAPQVIRGFSIGRANQGIGVITVNPSLLSAGQTTTASATAASGLAVRFNSTTPAVCTVNGATISGLAMGTCTITANQAGNASYNAAPQVTYSFTVNRGNQTIIPGIAPSIVAGGTGTLLATGGASRNPVTFASRTAGVCTTSGSNGATVTGIASGTCVITFNQVGNANYNAAPLLALSFLVRKGNQSITFGAAPSVVVRGSRTLSATGGTSGNPVSFTSQTANICTTSGSHGATVTGVVPGTCTITANQAGNANYNAAAPVSLSFIVNKANQTITFGVAPIVAVGGIGIASATGGASGSPVIFTSQTPNVCTTSSKLNGTAITGIRAGTCTIAATQAGNASYNASPRVTQSFTVR